MSGLRIPLHAKNGISGRPGQKLDTSCRASRRRLKSEVSEYRDPQVHGRGGLGRGKGGGGGVVGSEVVVVVKKKKDKKKKRKRMKGTNGS